jgi:hypothetical protein
MTNKASARSALLAIGLLLGLASASQAASSDSSAFLFAPQAAPTDTQPRSGAQAAASDQLNDADRALPAQLQSAPAETAVPPAQPDTQNQSMVPASASNDQNSGWDVSSLIGKIFIGCGTLLTLGSAAMRMLMAGPG